MFTYLTVEEVSALHEISIKKFGGADGLRDLGLLESAVYQCQQSFGGEDLYPELWDKAAITGLSIFENQPFLDGNKRTAALSMMVFLEINDYETIAKEGEVYEVIMKLANKKLTREALSLWLKKNTKKIQKKKKHAD